MNPLMISPDNDGIGNLLEDPRPAMSGHLFYDLDRIFNLCEDVDTSLDRGIGTLAKHFTSEAVDLLECIGGFLCFGILFIDYVCRKTLGKGFQVVDNNHCV